MVRHAKAVRRLSRYLAVICSVTCMMRPAVWCQSAFGQDMQISPESLTLEPESGGAKAAKPNLDFKELVKPNVQPDKSSNTEGNPACSAEATRRIDLGRDIKESVARECRPGLSTGGGSKLTLTPGGGR